MDKLKMQVTEYGRFFTVIKTYLVSNYDNKLVKQEMILPTFQLN